MHTDWSLTRRQLWLAWAGTLLCAGLMLFQLGELDRLLKTPVSPIGIVDLQLVRTAVEVEGIVSEWRQRDVLEAARDSLYIDFPFLVFYSLNLAISVVLVAGTAQPLQHFARAGLYCAFGAGLLDALENGAQLAMLAWGARDLLAVLSWATAMIKFLCIGIVIVYLAAGLSSRKRAQG